MKGKLIDFSFGYNRKQRITIEIDSDFREGYEALKDVELEVTIKKWRKKRSNDANAYAWVLIDKIANALSIGKEDVYRSAIRDIGGVSDIVCVQNAAVTKLCENWKRNGVGWQADIFPSKIDGCTNVILYYGSSTYDTKQMSRLIDHLVADAQALGIETMPPDRLAALIGAEYEST